MSSSMISMSSLAQSTNFLLRTAKRCQAVVVIAAVKADSRGHLVHGKRESFVYAADVVALAYGRAHSCRCG